MHQKIVIANWKSNKTSVEVQEWFATMQPVEGKTLVISPSFPMLPVVHHMIERSGLGYEIAAQDISPFDEGRYTGAVNGKQIKEFASYVLVGHSERRKYFHETAQELTKKVSMALQYQLTPVYLAQRGDEVIPQGVTIVVYEPVGAIGSGHPDTPEHALDVAAELREKNPQLQAVLYGGSVTPENVGSYTAILDGVIVGEGSLASGTFSQIVNNV